MAKVSGDGVSYPAYLFDGLASDPSSSAEPVSAATDDIFGANPLNDDRSDPGDILFGAGGGLIPDMAEGAANGVHAPKGVTMFGQDRDSVKGTQDTSQSNGAMDVNGTYDPLAWASTLKKSVSNKKDDADSDPMSLVNGARNEMSKFTGGDPLSYSSEDGSTDGSGDPTTDSGGDTSTDPSADSSGDASVDTSGDPSSDSSTDPSPP